MSDSTRGGVQGWREFVAEKRDLVRAYRSALEKDVSKPVHTEPGVVAESVFRSWLSGFLPGRYGVTSGYIISPGLSDEVPVKHFDVIIYDKLESPVLWRENNPDVNDHGARRPIPVEHVLAVLEVKATLTKRTATASLEKLRELEPLLSGTDDPTSPYPIYLRPTFVCGTVFFRVSLDASASVLESLIAPDLSNYFGGIVLSFKEYDDTDQSGLIRRLVGDEPFGDSREPVHTGSPIATSQEFQGKYYSTSLTWGENSFATFAYDLINHMSGRFRAGFTSSMYGMSFQSAESWRQSESILKIRPPQSDSRTSRSSPPT